MASAREALVAAVRWLAAHEAPLFRPIPDEPALLKRFAELGGLALALGDDPDLAATAAGWLDRMWALLDQGERLATLIDRDPAAAAYAPVYVPFWRSGRRHPPLEERLAAHAGAVPSRWFLALAVAVAYRQLGIPFPTAVPALLARAWLFVADELAPLSPARAYETTHVVLWAADLGELPSPIAERVRDWAPRWLDRALSVRDPDLAAEHALALLAAGGEVRTGEWDRLLSLAQADGSFLAPPPAKPHVLGKFHPTLVVAMGLAQLEGRKIRQIP